MDRVDKLQSEGNRVDFNWVVSHESWKTYVVSCGVMSETLASFHVGFAFLGATPFLKKSPKEDWSSLVNLKTMAQVRWWFFSLFWNSFVRLFKDCLSTCFSCTKILLFAFPFRKAVPTCSIGQISFYLPRVLLILTSVHILSGCNHSTSFLSLLPETVLEQKCISSN